MVAEQAPVWDKAGFHRDLLRLDCNPSTRILLAALQFAHGGPQLEQRSRLPAALREPPLQPRPASPSHDGISQAAAAVIAAPTAGAPAQADAAGAEAAAAAREALQAEVRHS